MYVMRKNLFSFKLRNMVLLSILNLLLGHLQYYSCTKLNSFGHEIEYCILALSIQSNPFFISSTSSHCTAPMVFCDN